MRTCTHLASAAHVVHALVERMDDDWFLVDSKRDYSAAPNCGSMPVCGSFETAIVEQPARAFASAGGCPPGPRSMVTPKCWPGSPGFAQTTGHLATSRCSSFQQGV